MSSLMQYEAQFEGVAGRVIASEGASFTAVTVSVKDCPALVSKPSDAVNVILVVPLAFATGAITAVQLGHVPPQVTAPVAATIDGVPDV